MQVNILEKKNNKNKYFVWPQTIDCDACIHIDQASKKKKQKTRPEVRSTLTHSNNHTRKNRYQPNNKTAKKNI